MQFYLRKEFLRSVSLRMSAPSRGCPTRRERLHPRFVLGNVSVLPEKPAWGKDLLGRTLWQAPGCWSSSEDAWRRPDPATERPKNKLTEEISVTRGQGTATVSVMVKSPHLDGTRGVGLRGSSALLCENHWRWTTLGHFFFLFFFLIPIWLPNTMNNNNNKKMKSANRGQSPCQLRSWDVSRMHTWTM